MTGTVPPLPRRGLLVPLGVALAGVAVGAGLTLARWSAIPARVVQHWGPGGRPDAWTSRESALASGIVLGLLFPALMAVLGHAVRAAAMAGVASGLAVFLDVLLFGSLLGQADGRTAVGPLLLLALLPAVVVGLLAFWIARDRRPDPAAERGAPLPDGAPRVEVPMGARLAWLGRTRTTRGTSALMCGTALLPLAVALLTSGSGVDPWLMGFLAVTGLVVLVLLSSMWSQVTVDRRGVRAVSLGVIPWVRIPLATIEGATTQEVAHPLGEFGGLGLRSNGERQGLITARGPALVVQRASRPDYLITVEDPTTAAACLNALVARR